MLVACLLFFTCNILDFSVQFYHVIQAFTVSSEGAIAEFLKMSDWTNVLMVMHPQLFIIFWDNTLI